MAKMEETERLWTRESILQAENTVLQQVLASRSPEAAEASVSYARFLRLSGLDPENYETYMLIQDGVASFKSEATLRMAEGLGFPWSLAGIFRILPLGLRDRFYNWVARNRFRFFGRRTSCYRPDTQYAGRFLA